MSLAALSVSAMSDRAGARDLARVLLDEPDLRRRWAHTVAVAGAGQRVADAAGLAGRDAELLVAAAWLHDIGYSSLLRASGFHPLGGARFLRLLGAPASLATLVANHTAAHIEADVRGVAQELAEFPPEQGFVADVLAYADSRPVPTAGR